MSKETIIERTGRTWARRTMLCIAALLLIPSLLLVIGGFIPALPYVGLFGSLAISLWPAWILLVALTGALVAWWLARGRTRALLLAAAAIAALGSSVATIRLLMLASANDVRLSLGAPFGFGGLLGKAAPPDESKIYLRDLGEDLPLHIWQPRGPMPGGGWPVLVYVHGGGWNSGAAAGRGADLRWFADQGWLVVGVDYSLSGKKRHLWGRVHGQLGCALAWTNANIAGRGGNPGRLALFGESAGGNLVLNVASLANAGTLPSICGGAVPRIGAVSAVYPAADIAAVWNNRYVPTGADVRVMAEEYIGGSPAAYPDRYAATASATHLGASTPPTLLFISENDHLVPVESMRAYDRAARRAGVRVRTVEIPFAEHGFDATGIGNALVRQTTMQFLGAELADAGARAAAAR